MHPSALWAKSVTWGTPLAASSCLCAPFSFLPLLSSLCLLFLHPLAGSLSPCFPVCLFLLSIKAFSSPFSFSFFPIFFLSTPSFLFLSFFPSPFPLFFHSSSLPLIFPVALSFLSPPSVSFMHHFGSIGLEQGARERGSVQRQSPAFPPQSNPIPYPPSISPVFFPCWGPGSALGF